MITKSKSPRKQRKFLRVGSFHILKHVISSHLSPELRKKYGVRSIGVRTGDNVKIMRGDYKGKIGKVERVFIHTRSLYIEGISMEKANGAKSKVPISPSNVMIQDLNLSDKWRKEILQRRGAKKAVNKEAA